MNLYDYCRSSAAYRVRIGLHLKSVDFRSIPIDLKPDRSENLSAAYRQINVHGRVPSLSDEQGVLTQSLAILEWLDETQPDPPFLPTDPWERAQVRSFAQLITSDIHPLNNLSVLARLKSDFQANEASLQSWYSHWVTSGFEALETKLKGRPKTRFAYSDLPSLADICLIPQMYNARRYNIDVESFPRLLDIEREANTHQAFVQAHPDNVRSKDSDQ